MTRPVAVLALLSLGACAPRAALPPSAGAAALAPSPAGRAAATAPAPACPGDIVREPALGAGVQGMAAGHWVQAPSEDPRGFRQPLALAAGAHQVVAVGGGLAVLREQPRGACVVNSWGVYLDGKTTLRPAGWWQAKDGRLAVLLLSILAEREGQAPEQRWMVLATDGRRLWPAVGDADQQLMVPGAALKERGGQLQLEVRQRRTSVYAFDPKTGRFVTH